MTWILALTSVGLVLWGVGVWSMCKARGELWVTVGDDTVHESHLALPPHSAAWHDANYTQLAITVMRHKGYLLVGMQARGETWMYVIEAAMVPCLGVAMWPAVLNNDLSLTKDDATAMVLAVERYVAAERSVVEQLQSTRT